MKEGIKMPIYERETLCIILAFLVFNLFVFGSAYGKEYTLDEIIGLAVEKNVELSILKARLEANRGRVVSARAFLNPEVDFTIGRGKEMRASVFEYSFGVAQTLEFPSKRFFRLKFAETLVEVSEKDIDYLLLEIKSRVKKAFLKLVLDKKILSVLEENIKAIDELVKAVQIKFEIGEVSEYDYVKVKTDYLTATNELRRAKNNVQISKSNLNSILANSLQDDFDVIGELIFREEKYKLEDLLSSMKEKHPLILRAKKEVDLKRYALQKERVSFLPDITLKLFYDSEVDKKLYGVGFSLSLPVFYRNMGEIITASMELAEAEYESQKILVEMSKAVNEEYQNYLSSYERAKTFREELLMNARRALELSKLSYLQGESGLLDYLDSLRVYRLVLIEYYQTLFELEVSITELEKLTGGIK
ncbi:MAG: TolC family protein [Candidatus Calescibacterium sp.]|nr:TolC family protein [Candidatus Calescibacterium sp.]